MRLVRTLGPVVVLAAVAALALADKMPKGRWAALVVPGAKWTLDNPADYGPARITLEVGQARQVAGASVLDLTWTFEPRNNADEDGDFDTGPGFLPERIAIGKKGIYVLDRAATDAVIAKAVKRKPTFADGGRTTAMYTRKDGAFTFIPKGRPTVACYGLNDPLGDCEDVPCTAWLCFDAKTLVAVKGGENDTDFGVEFLSPDIADYASPAASPASSP